jgi:protocatechuate 3,4-dioxygenase alpha subunit
MLMSALQANYGQTPSQTVGPYFAYGLTATQYGYDFDQPFDDRAGAGQRHAASAFASWAG